MDRRLRATAFARRTCLACTAGVALATSAGAQLPAQASDGVQASTTGISPLFGKIRPFWDDGGQQITPMFGKIRPFFGKIRPFFGDVSGFWGGASPFMPVSNAQDVAFYGNQDPFWGSANPYQGKNGAFYGALNGFWSTQFTNWQAVMTAWSTAQTPRDAAALAGMIQSGLVAPSAAFWDQAIGGKGNKSSSTALINAQLQAAGVTLAADGSIDPSSLLALSPSQQALLFLGVYDSLMDYAGTGHADWWMGAIHWSPALAEQQGSVPKGGTPPTIGMLDFVIAQGKNVPKQVTQYGSTNFNDGHGAAVGSLLIGATDGSGVMGMLPAGSANVKVYNPYDDSGTTNWTDVGTGIATLVKSVFLNPKVPVGVLNASLGVPGWTLHPGWNDALANANAYGHDLVVAAGNDGVMQTQNVPWNFAKNPTLLIVGSIGADGTISNFSNTPGEACLLPTSSSSTVCAEANKLKYRFIVAPGELVLVSDGVGGHYRQSGTSLAAPFVSGTIALLQNRWPWLSNYPDETASIILKSATPLGTNPGADPVYGVGELNVAASQSPLNWSSLIYVPANNGKTSSLASLATGTNGLVNWPLLQQMGQTLTTVSSQLAGGTQSSWNASGLSYSAFERVGNTFRDFYIPLSAKLVGQTVNTQAGGQGFQSYLALALRGQTGHFATLDAPAPANSLLANGYARDAMPAGMVGSMQLRVNVAQTAATVGFRNSNNSNLYETGATLVGERSSFSFGWGNGASALDPAANFSFRSDHDLATGGANPVLGLASGGAYLGARAAVAPRLTIGFGTTRRDVWRNPVSFGIQPQTSGDWVNRYAAAASTMTADYAVSHQLTAHVGFTHLAERDALLGIQSVDRADLNGGSTTTAGTAGFDLRLRHGLTLSGSGTMARTHAGGGQITTNDLTGMAAELAVTKTGVLGRRDQLRLTAATPLHTVAGRLLYGTVGVTDRETGTIGLVSQSVDARPANLPFAAEASYGRSLTGGRGELSLFARYQRAGQITQGDYLGTMGGAQLRLAF